MVNPYRYAYLMSSSDETGRLLAVAMLANLWRAWNNAVDRISSASFNWRCSWLISWSYGLSLRQMYTKFYKTHHTYFLHIVEDHYIYLAFHLLSQRCHLLFDLSLFASQLQYTFDFMVFGNHQIYQLCVISRCDFLMFGGIRIFDKFPADKENIALKKLLSIVYKNHITATQNDLIAGSQSYLAIISRSSTRTSKRSFVLMWKDMMFS